MFAFCMRKREIIVNFADLDLLKEAAEIIKTHPE